MVFMDITPFQVEQIRMPEARITAEQKGIAYPVKMFFLRRNLVCHELLQFIGSEKNHLLIGRFELCLEAHIGRIGEMFF